MRWYTWGYGHVIQQFTFWGRKAAAERVGRGEMAVALSQISSKWRGWRQGDSTTAFNSLIFVGHSFGGAALLSSTLPWVLSTAQNSSDSLAAPADLVIALNPAVQAGILDQTVLSPVLKLATDSARLTKLLVFAATNDFANKWFFPIGRALDSPIGQLGNGRYWRAERQAAGRPSYQLQFLLDPYEGSSSPIILASQDGGNDPALCSRYTTNDDDDDGKFRNLGLTRLNTAVPCRNSVMVVQSRKGVIHSHNGIWSVAARDFIQQFVAEQQRQRERSVTTYLQQKAK
jgi:hypothetical protein